MNAPGSEFKFEDEEPQLNLARVFEDVKNRLSSESRVVYVEAGTAFEGGMQTINDPASQDFFKNYLNKIVSTFLRQRPSNLAPNILQEFDKVLRGAEFVIQWDLITNKSLHYLQALEVLFSPHHSYYSDMVHQNSAYFHTSGLDTAEHISRSQIIKSFDDRGCFDLLLRIMRGEEAYVNANTDYDEEDDQFDDHERIAGNIVRDPIESSTVPKTQKLSLALIRQLLIPFVLVRDVLSGYVEEACEAAMDQIRKLTDHDVKGENAQDIADLHDLLEQVYGSDDATFIHFSNELALTAFNSKAFPMRKQGLEMIIKTVGDLQREESYNVNADRASPFQQDNGTEFTGDDMVEWVQRNKIIYSLFGAKKSTHHALISKSKILLQYLHTRGSMTEGDLKLIFRSSLGNHESIQGAVFTILAELAFDHSAPTASCCYILDFAAALEVKYAKEQVSFIRKVMETRQQSRVSQRSTGYRGYHKASMGYPSSKSQVGSAESLPFIESLLKLMWSALFRNSGSQESQEYSQMLMRYAIDVVRVPEASNLREKYMNDLVSMIQKSKASQLDGDNSIDAFQVNQAYDLLKRMVHCYQTNENNWQQTMPGSPSPTSRREVIERLENQYHLLDLIVEETKAMDLSNSSDNLDSVSYRLDFLAYIIPRSNLKLAFKHVQDLWEALATSEERDMFYMWLRRMGTSDFEGELSFSTDTLSLIFDQLLCSRIDFTKFSIQGYRCLAAFFLEVNKVTGALEGESELSPSSHAAASPTGTSRPQSPTSSDGRPEIHAIHKPHLHGLDTIWQVILTAPAATAREATELLLQAQIKLESLETSDSSVESEDNNVATAKNSRTNMNTDLGTECRKAFLARILSYMEQGPKKQMPPQEDSSMIDITVGRCIQLLGAYLDQYPLPIGIQPHAPVSGLPIELVVHHDEIMLHSDLDVGKQLQKRFKLKSHGIHGPAYEWYGGFIYKYDQETLKHGVYFVDTTQKDYDIHTLTRVGGIYPTTGEWQYKMIPIHKYCELKSEIDSMELTTEERQTKLLDARKMTGILSLQEPASKKVMAGVEQYQPIRLHVRQGTTIGQVKSLIYETILKSVHGKVPVIPDNMVFRKVVQPSVARNALNASNNREPQQQAPAKPQYRTLTGASNKETLESILLNGEHEIHLEYNPNIPGSATAAPLAGDEEADALPGSIVTNRDSAFFRVFMNLLDSEQVPYSTLQRLWHLLMALPTDQNQFALLRDDGKAIDWEKKLDPKGVCVLRQVYILQVVNTILEDGTESAQTWSQDFLSSGGFVQVCSLLEKVLAVTTAATDRVTLGQSSPGSPSLEEQASYLVWQRGVALPVLLRIIKCCVSASFNGAGSLPEGLFTSLATNLGILLTSIQSGDALRANRLLHSVDAAQSDDEALVVQNVDVDASGSGWSVAGSGTQPEGANLKKQAELCCTAVDILRLVISARPTLAYRFIDQSTSQCTVLDVLLLSPTKPLRKALSELLHHVIEVAGGAALAGREPVALVLTKLAIGALERIPVGSDTCGIFFAFLRHLVKEQLEKQGPDMTFSAVVRGAAEVIARRIVAYSALVEDDSGPRRKRPLSPAAPGRPPLDQTLLGYLLLMYDVVNMLGARASWDAALCEPLMDCLLNRYLVALPTPQDRKRLAIAHHPRTRQACFDLLRALARAAEGNLEWLARRLADFFEDTTIPSNRTGRTEWAYQVDSLRRTRDGFVGLANQGATCYQNSVLQQLFMAPKVREMILHSVPSWTSALVKEEDTRQTNNAHRSPNAPRRKLKPRTKSNLIKTLQRTFTFLSESDHPYFNPRPFVFQTSVLKLSDGHLNQNDAIEFYSRIVECFEESLAGQQDQQRLKELLYVRTCTMNVRSCRGHHRTQTEMATPFLTLNIQSGATGPTLHSLQEALESQFSTEKLSGLQCEICNAEDNPDARYDADQVKYFEKLPPVLVMQLQRFDFDYELLVPTKLNHRVSFDRRIDLTKFTRDDVLRKFGNDEEVDGPPSSAAPPVHGSPGAPEKAENAAIYELKGVVVHHGSGANFGHYYSFIEDRATGVWYRFDDDKVTPFDLSCLEAECYGGPYQSSGDSYAAGGQAVGGSSPQMMASSPYSRMPMYGGKGANFKSNNAYLLLYEQVNPDRETALASVRVPRAPASRAGMGVPGATRCVVGLMRWKRRAVARMEAKQRMKRYMTEAWEENQRAIRHGIGYSNDFLEFCWRVCSSALSMHDRGLGLPVSLLESTNAQFSQKLAPGHSSQSQSTAKAVRQVAILSATLFVKVAIHAASQKGVLQHWVNCISQVMALDIENQRTGVIAADVNLEAFEKIAHRGRCASNAVEWFLLKLLQNDDTRTDWFEGPLLNCPDQHSREAYMQLLGGMIRSLSENGSQEQSEVTSGLNTLRTFARTLIQVTPQEPVNCIQLQPLFHIWKELSLNQSLQDNLLQLNAPAILLRLYKVNDPSSLSMMSQEDPEQKMNANDPLSSPAFLANRNSSANFTALIHAVTICLAPESAKLLLHQDSMNARNMLGNQTLGGNEQYHNSRLMQLSRLLRNHRLSKLPDATEAELFTVQTVRQLSSRDPGPASTLLAFLVQGEEEFTEEAMQELDYSLRDIPKTSSEMQFSQRLADVVDCICCISMVIDNMSERRCREMVEGALSLVEVLHRECCAADNFLKSARGRSTPDNQRRMIDEERMKKTHLLFGVATMFVNLFYCNMPVRAVLKETVARWSWMPQFLDNEAYERYMGGIPEVRTRNVALGCISRSIAKVVFSLTGECPALVPLRVTCCEVENCGLQVLNGSYRFDGFFVEGASPQVDSTTPKFVRMVDGVRYVLYRCKVRDLKYNWYISNVSKNPGTASDKDYCCAVQADSESHPTLLPPQTGWQMCGNNPGPAPRVHLVQREMDPTEDLFEWTEDMSRYSGVDTSVLLSPSDGDSISSASESNSSSDAEDVM